MNATATGTASIASETSAKTSPCLVRLLAASRPTAGSLRIELGGLREITIERGAPRSVHRTGRRATIKIVDGKVSMANHARLVQSDQGFWLQDGGSKNGTYCNGPRIETPVLLADGDIIQTGATFWRYSHQESLERDIDSDDIADTPTVMQTMTASLVRSFDELSQVAVSCRPILIRGETGTGKEQIARAIHNISGRTGRFVAVNCGAIPANLMESELFGHVKGAFSGATESHEGLITAANGGTLLLDEIAELPVASQVALLRVLQEQEVRPVGSTRSRKVDVRVLSATNQDLIPRLEDGRFRADLYERLVGYTFTLPPLRERKDDIGLIVSNILKTENPSIKLRRSTAATLIGYDYPRNIRELENALRTVAIFATTEKVDRRHLPDEFKNARFPGDRAIRCIDDDDKLHNDLVRLFKKHKGNVSAVARESGKDRTQLRRWVQRFGIDIDRFRKI